MIPIITPEQMERIDRAATESIDVLVERAGRAVARTAVSMMGGTYGRRVAVIVGPGNNGADGRVAARALERAGVRCRLIPVDASEAHIDGVDLVVDAAFGNGLRRPYVSPTVAIGIAVLAVDLPSGVDGLTGEVLGRPIPADRTVTFVALKPGLVVEPGRSLSGIVEVVDVGLEATGPVGFVVEDVDVADLVPSLLADDHKWKSGVRIVGGAPGMTGAAALAARSAQRCGAGIVQLAMPGATGSEGPTEAVGHPLPETGWAVQAFSDLPLRVAAVLVGPGLGPVSAEDLRAAAAVDRPVVFDGDALQAELVPLLADRSAPSVMTPHDGEWARLGGALGGDRIQATADFAARHNVTVIRKGPSTIVASPGVLPRVVTVGTAALATAGTGDVLAGAVVALLARGAAAGDAGVIAAHVHGRAGARLGPGLVASEVADALPAEFATLRSLTE